MIWLLVSPQQRKSIDGAHDTRIAYICPVHLCEWIKMHYLHLIFEILRFGYVNSNGDIAGAIVFWHSFENNIDQKRVKWILLERTLSVAIRTVKMNSIHVIAIVRFMLMYRGVINRHRVCACACILNRLMVFGLGGPCKHVVFHHFALIFHAEAFR